MIQYRKNPMGISQTRQAPNIRPSYAGINPNIRPEPAGFIQKFSTILKAWRGAK